MRTAAWLALYVAGATLLGALAAVGLALIRGGVAGELASSLWGVGALMLLLALVGLSPSTRAGGSEIGRLSLGRRYGAPTTEDSPLLLTVTFGLAALALFALATLVG